MFDSTPSGTTATSYLSIEEADDLFDAFEQGDAWEALEIDDKGQLLMQGTRLIDEYRSWGPEKVQPTPSTPIGQQLSFPRAVDKALTIPREVKLALMEYVDYRLDGKLVALKRAQAEGVKAAAILGQTSVLDSDVSQLPAGSRKYLDQLYRANAPNVTNRAIDMMDGDQDFF